ncbi:hypothetical protein T492DRAFT_886860 [Pavlovales sp. CCMP2436]|nr:hypothetical protein T492DRAFT_886860 [Pavlovales sp. CCMP2436]
MAATSKTRASRALSLLLVYFATPASLLAPAGVRSPRAPLLAPHVHRVGSRARAAPSLATRPPEGEQVYKAQDLGWAETSESPLRRGIRRRFASLQRAALGLRYARNLRKIFDECRWLLCSIQ